MTTFKVKFDDVRKPKSQFFNGSEKQTDKLNLGGSLKIISWNLISSYLPRIFERGLLQFYRIKLKLFFLFLDKWPNLNCSVFKPDYVGGDEMRSGYVPYIQGIQPNVPAHTTFIDIHAMYWPAIKQVTLNTCISL